MSHSLGVAEGVVPLGLGKAVRMAAFNEVVSAVSCLGMRFANLDWFEQF